MFNTNIYFFITEVAIKPPLNSKLIPGHVRSSVDSSTSGGATSPTGGTGAGTGGGQTSDPAPSSEGAAASASGGASA